MLLGGRFVLAPLPHTEQFALYPSPSLALDENGFTGVADIELRRWSDLEPIGKVSVPEEDVGIYSFSFSLDGRWMAIGCVGSLVLVNQQTGKVVDTIAWGDINHSMVFDPTSTYLAVATAGQGGGGASVFKVTQEQLIPVYNELDRTGIQGSDLADTSASMVFSPDGQVLAIYFNAGFQSEWSGELVVYAMNTGERLWHHSFSSADPSFYSDIVFTSSGEYLVCGSYRGNFLVFQSADGQFVQWIDSGSQSPIQALARQQESPLIWAVVDHQIRSFNVVEHPRTERQTQ